MSGGSTGTNTVVQNSQPPQQFLDAYSNITNQAANVAAQPYQPYSGQLVAGLTGDQNAGIAATESAVGSANPYLYQAGNYIDASTQPVINGQVQNYLSNATGPQNGIAAAAGSFNPTTIQQYESPYTQQVVDATQAEFNNQNQQQNQSIIGNAASQGAWGGDRAGVAQGIAAGQEALAQAPQIAALENQGYQTGVAGATTAAQLGLQGATTNAGLQQQAANTVLGGNEANSWLNSQAGFAEGNLGQEALSTGLTGANALLGVGGLQQQQNQENLNVPYEQYVAQQAYPFQTTGWEAGIDEGLGSASGGTSSTSYPGASAVSQIAGLGTAGLGAASLYNSGAFSGIGSGISSLVGAGGTGAGIGVDSGWAAAAADVGPFLAAARGGGIAGHRAHGGTVVPMPHIRARTGIAANDDWMPHRPAMRAMGGSTPIDVEIDQQGGSGSLPVQPTGIAGAAPPQIGSPAPTARGISPAMPPQGMPGMPTGIAGAGGVNPQALAAMQAQRGGIGIPRAPQGGMTAPTAPMAPQADAGGLGQFDQALMQAKQAGAFQPQGQASGGGIAGYDDGGGVDDDGYSSGEGPGGSFAGPPIPPSSGPPPPPSISMQSSTPTGIAAGAPPSSDKGDPTVGLALLRAGFGIMGGRSPNAAVNIGRGAGEGIDFYEKASNLHDQQATNKAWRESQAQIAQDTAARKDKEDSFNHNLALQRLDDARKKAEHDMQKDDQRTDIERGHLGVSQASLAETQRYHDETLKQGKYTWQPGQQTDPATGKPVDGSWRYSTKGDEAPTFYPGVVTTRNQNANTAQQRAGAAADASGDRGNQAAANRREAGARAIMNANPNVPYDKALQQYDAAHTGDSAAPARPGASATLPPGPAVSAPPSGQRPPLSSIFGAPPAPQVPTGE